MPEPVLLLHGQPGSAGDWNRVIATLAGRVRAIAFDRPGWDGTTPATDLAGNARAALAALDAAEIEAATVVGHSFGGAVAAWLAAHHGERVRTLVLAAPSANQASLYPVDWWLSAPVVGFAASALTLSAAGGVLYAAPLRRLIARELAVDDAYLRRAARRLLTPGAWRSFVREQRVLVSDLPILEQRLGRITAPTRIVAGSKDPVVPRRSLRELLRQIPDAQLVEIERAGHLLPLRHAEELAAAIVDAVNDAPAVTGAPASTPGPGSGTAGVGGSSG